MVKKGTDMKKNAVLFFFKSLLKSILVIVSILAVGVISYKVSYQYLSKQLEAGKLDVQEKELESILDQAKTDEISKNLIYVVNDKQMITHMMLEICNTKTNNMDYITIPVTTDYTIPSVMYRKLCQVNEEIPQVIRISKLLQYFEDESKAYGYGELIFEKMLGTDISYYTVLKQETYDNHYTQQKVKVAYKTKSSENNTPGPDGMVPVTNTTLKTKMNITVLSDTYKRQISDLGHDQDKIAEFIKDQYEGVASNLTVYNKLGYVEAYEKMDCNLYHFWGVPGKYSRKLFEVDTKATKKAIKYLVENGETYVQEQDLTAANMIRKSQVVSKTSPSPSPVSTKSSKSTKSAKKTNSKDLKIYVSNGSQIAGLAASTQKKLKNAGYNVPEVGNYTGKTLTTTKIIVSKKGQGEDLKEYFNNAQVTVGSVSKGYDIEIILGTRDANSR